MFLNVFIEQSRTVCINSSLQLSHITKKDRSQHIYSQLIRFFLLLLLVTSLSDIPNIFLILALLLHYYSLVFQFSLQFVDTQCQLFVNLHVIYHLFWHLLLYVMCIDTLGLSGGKVRPDLHANSLERVPAALPVHPHHTIICAMLGHLSCVGSSNVVPPIGIG